MSEINNIHARLKRAFEKRGVDFSGEGQVNDTNPIMYQRAFNILKRKGADFSTPSGHPSFDSIRGINGRHFPHQKVPNAFVANPNWNGYGKVDF